MEDTEKKIAEARSFCIPYLGNFACTQGLSGNEVLAFQETVDRLAKKLTEREEQINWLQSELNNQVEPSPFGYLASPYTHSDERIMEERYEKALAVTAQLLTRGIHVYSPIVHCHELAKRHDLPREVFFWEDYNKTMLENASTLYILTLPGWDTSVGIGKECKLMEEFGKPMIQLFPEDFNI